MIDIIARGMAANGQGGGGTLPEKLQYLVNNLNQEKFELLVNFINDLTEVEEDDDEEDDNGGNE